jgi:hypothetical protein
MSGSTTRGGQTEADVVDAGGNLRVPEDYRRLYQALGSWAIAADDRLAPKEFTRSTPHQGRLMPTAKVGVP